MKPVIIAKAGALLNAAVAILMISACAYGHFIISITWVAFFIYLWRISRPNQQEKSQ